MIGSTSCIFTSTLGGRLQISYVYHALYSYFDRDNVGLPGIAAFYKAAATEEREHAEILMKYQTRRGGRVELHVRVPHTACASACTTAAARRNMSNMLIATTATCPARDCLVLLISGVHWW